MGPKSFMIVDDSEVDRFVHTKLLNLTGLAREVSEFSSGQSALNALKENKNTTNALPDIILLDIMMPEMSGFDFLAHFEHLVKQLDKKPVIFMLSSSDDEGDYRRANASPFVIRLLKKPFSPKAFKEMLEKLEF